MCGPILFRKREARMKQIVIEIEDEAYEPFMGMLRLCPAARVVGTSMVVETRDVIGRCVALAIKKLREDRVFKHPGDYTYIMRGANEGVIKGMGFFYYPSEFLAYLREIGIDKLPGRNTLYDGITRTFGKFPEWTFSDHPSADEVMRRKNVLKRFLSAYTKIKLNVSDAISDATFLSAGCTRKYAYLCTVGKKRPTVFLNLLIQRTFRKA